jgi:hypothetical protein
MRGWVKTSRRRVGQWRLPRGVCLPSGSSGRNGALSVTRSSPAALVTEQIKA